MYTPPWFRALWLVGGLGGDRVGDSAPLSGSDTSTPTAADTTDSVAASCLPAHDDCDWETCGEAEPGEAPPPHGDSPFFIAGTVYDSLLGGEGTEDAVVVVYDVQGIRVELTTNAWGNFYSNQPLTPPFTAEVRVGKETLEMSTPVETGACNSGHRCDGEAGGKLYAPEAPE